MEDIYDPSNVDPTVVSEQLIDLIKNDEKRASTVMSEWIKLRLRESAFMRQVIPVKSPPNKIPGLARDEIYTIVFKEPPTATAAVIPFGGQSRSLLMRGERMYVSYDRVNGRTYEIDDIIRFGVYPEGMDIRSIIADNCLKEIQYREDSKWLEVIEALVGSPGSTSPYTGYEMCKNMGGSIERGTLYKIKALLRQCDERLSPSIMLLNFITELEFEGFDRNSVGGDLAESILLNGWAEENILGMRAIYTNKVDLVPTGSIFLFAPAEYMGVFYSLQDPTMYIEKKNYTYSMFPSEVIGGAIVNAAAVARANFTTSF